jgi:hypothetical protein
MSENDPKRSGDGSGITDDRLDCPGGTSRGTADATLGGWANVGTNVDFGIGASLDGAIRGGDFRPAADMERALICSSGWSSSSSSPKPHATSVCACSAVLGTLNPGGGASAAGSAPEGVGHVPFRADADARSSSALAFDAVRWWLAPAELGRTAGEAARTDAAERGTS